MIELSFIIPVHNSYSSLRMCIESVYACETDKSYEIVAVDDYSQDNSYELLEELAKEKPANCSFVIEKLPENVGVQKTRFVGLEKSKGKYVYFLDSDDEVTPDFIEEVINKMEDEKLDILLINADVIEGKKKFTLISKQSFDHVRKYGTYGECVLFGDFGFTCVHVLKRTAFDHIKINELPKLSFTEDLNLFTEITSKKELSAGILDKNLYHYYMPANWHKSKMNVSNAKDSVYVLNRRYELMKKDYPDLVEVFKYGNLKAALRLIHSVKKTKNIARKEKKELIKWIKSQEVIKLLIDLSYGEYLRLPLKDKMRYRLYK